MSKALAGFGDRLKTLLGRTNDKVERFIPVLCVGSFIVGIFLAKFSPLVAHYVNQSVAFLIDGYTLLAPIAIFLIFTPSLGRLLRMNRGGQLGRYVIKWFAFRRLTACLWAVLFTAVIFRFPLIPSHSVGIVAAFTASGKSFFWMITHNTYFYALYLGIIVSSFSVRLPRLSMILDNAFEAVESIGQYLTLFMPLFMMAVGVYIYSLPEVLDSQLNLKELAVVAGRVDFIGVRINPHTPRDFILVYVIGSLLVAIACFVWHGGLILWAKTRVPWFSIRKYMWGYWVRVYPLLWATSSESLATPLNLYLTKLHFPQIKEEVRRFVVGMGSYMNICGTMICVFVLLGVVANLIGIRLSVLELLFCVPIVFVIGYGVPGIPGELVLFAGPIALILNLPEEIVPLFIALYSGLQLGLPDSFRTGNNSTDNCLSAILINDTFEKRYAARREE